MLDLKNFFITESSIQALDQHNDSGDKHGTNISINFNELVIEDETIMLFLTVKTLIEESHNPSYAFTITAAGGIGFKEIKHAEEAAAISMSLGQILIGVVRQHISSVTAMMPWGRFNLGLIDMRMRKEFIDAAYEKYISHQINSKTKPKNVKLKPKATIKKKK